MENLKNPLSVFFTVLFCVFSFVKQSLAQEEDINSYANKIFVLEAQLKETEKLLEDQKRINAKHKFKKSKKNISERENEDEDETNSLLEENADLQQRLLLSKNLLKEKDAELSELKQTNENLSRNIPVNETALKTSIRFLEKRLLDTEKEKAELEKDVNDLQKQVEKLKKLSVR